MAFRKRNLARFSLFLLVLQATYLHGQNAETISVTFRGLQLGSTPITELHFQNGTGVIECLTFDRITKSPSYSYEGPNPIEFFRPEFDPETQSVTKVPLVSVYIPDECISPLIFFEKIPSNDQSDPAYTIYIIDESIKKFPNESMIALNTTGRKLYGKLGKRNLTLETGASKPFDTSQNTESTTRVQLAINSKDGPRMVFTNGLKFRNNQRNILVVAPPRRPGSIQVLVYTLSESLPSIVQPSSVMSQR